MPANQSSSDPNLPSSSVNPPFSVANLASISANESFPSANQASTSANQSSPSANQASTSASPASISANQASASANQSIPIGPQPNSDDNAIQLQSMHHLSTDPQSVERGSELPLPVTAVTSSREPENFVQPSRRVTTM
jgi:hypothetical protein